MKNHVLVLLYGQLEVLQLMRAQDPPCPWNAGSCANAAMRDGLEVLQWLRAQDLPCPWDELAVGEAIKEKELTELLWLLTHNAPCPPWAWEDIVNPDFFQKEKNVTLVYDGNGVITI
jgi:hypothetical protein